MTSTGRVETLDAVRGIAVMGILAMNVAGFALPYPAYANPAAYGGDSGLDLASWAFNFVLFDTKMRSLFSILFGATTLLVIDRATQSGRNAFAAHYARMIVLLLVGCLHFWFLWFGDILALYALSGMALYWLRDIGVGKLAARGLALILMSSLFYGLIGWSAMMAGSPKLSTHAATELTEARETVEQEVGATSRKIPQDLRRYRGPYGPILDHRLDDRRYEPFLSFLGLGAETLGLMMIGMALFRTGFLTGEWQPERYRRWAVTGAAVALPVLTVLAWWQVSSGFDSAVIFTAFMGVSQPFDLLLAIVWAALVILWVKRGGSSPLRDRVAAAGRMAFTNYLATSLVMTTIFYGYGLGLFGHVARAGLWLFVLAMWGLMLLWSKPWLDRFNYGPLEWLWRSLSRLRLQPLRKA